jgi:1,2-diacylglycerol 3-alpha-glucosyltransferase
MFSDYFFPELGGIQDSVAIVGAALGRRGHQVEIVVPRYGTRDYRLVGATPGERDLGLGVRVHRRRSLPFPSSTRQSRAALPHVFSWLGPRPDVIHVHSFFGIGLEALLDAAVLGRPVVGTNHTTVAGFGGHMPVSVRSASAYVTWFYNRCDMVTAPSRSVFADLGLDRLRRPHRVVSNPIDTPLFAPVSAAKKAALRRAFGFTAPTIAYAGRLGAEKHVEVLVRALAAMAADAQPPCLALAGHGAHEGALRALAASLGVADRMRFLGTLAPADLARLLAASDVFAMPSTSETQSMALLQAMACGLPAVAAHARALPEFVRPDTGLLVAPDDVPGWAAALGALLREPARRVAMGEAARRAAGDHGIETVTDAWEDIYDAVRHGRLQA